MRAVQLCGDTTLAGLSPDDGNDDGIYCNAHCLPIMPSSLLSAFLSWNFVCIHVVSCRFSALLLTCFILFTITGEDQRKKTMPKLNSLELNRHNGNNVWYSISWHHSQCTQQNRVSFSAFFSTSLLLRLLSSRYLLFCKTINDWPCTSTHKHVRIN